MTHCHITSALSHHTFFLYLNLSCTEDKHGSPQASASMVEGPWPFHQQSTITSRGSRNSVNTARIVSALQVVVHGAGAGVERLCNPLPGQPWNYHFTRAAREITSNPHLHLVGLLICRVPQVTRQLQASSPRQTFSADTYIDRCSSVKKQEHLSGRAQSPLTPPPSPSPSFAVSLYRSTLSSRSKQFSMQRYPFLAIIPIFSNTWVAFLSPIVEVKCVHPSLLPIATKQECWLSDSCWYWGSLPAFPLPGHSIKASPMFHSSFSFG